MAIQYILAGRPRPIFINETNTLDFILPGVYANASTSGAAGNHNLLPLMGVGAKEPTAVDLLVSGALFAGLLVHKNPVTERRRLFTFGLSGKPRG